MNDQEYIRTHRPDEVVQIDSPSQGMFDRGYSSEMSVYALAGPADEYIVEIIEYEYYNGHPMEGGCMRRDISTDIRHVDRQELERLKRSAR